MYLQQFALTRYPFDAAFASEQTLSTDAVKETERRIAHLLELKGIGLISGEAGCGKTTACRRAVDKLHPGQFEVFYASLTTGTVVDTLNVIASAMRLPEQRIRSRAWRVIRDEVKRLGDEKKILPLLVVDEAHHLRNDILEDLRLICNFNFDSENRLCLLLVGLSELRHRLKMSANESMAQRLVMNHHFVTFTCEETAEYVAHRMKVAGSADLEHFEKAALMALHQASGGVPRKINRIAHYGLMAATSDKAQQVSASHVELACQEIKL